MPHPRYRILPHTADIRLAVWGDDEEELVQNAVTGTLAVALGHAPAGAPASRAPIEPWPAALEPQLVVAANEALFLLYARGQVAVGLETSRRSAWLTLRPATSRDVPEREIKAATFHALCLGRTGRRLRAVLVLDL